MLRAHQACVDLERNVLRIREREVKFLDEHELPEMRALEQTQDQGPGSQPSGSESSNPPTSTRWTQGLSFPWQRNTLSTPKDTSQEAPTTATAAKNKTAGDLEEAASQWQVVLENLEYAMEYTPELFGRVIML